ncbi:MAG: hypothetical protein KDB23_26680 [Planctomycetales bacterium]|nr:hypothetical protein [Planctomycetales bacterium]
MSLNDIPSDDIKDKVCHDGLSAADNALALWIVRIPFGVLAVGMILLGLDDSFHGHPERLGVLPLAIEPAYIALCGRSLSLRYLLAGDGRHDGKTARGDSPPP